MMLFHASALLLLFVQFAQCQTGCGTDFFQCQRKFNDYLGLNETQPWHNPEAFRQVTENFYQHGSITGLRKVCRGFREFKSCLGDSYSSCISVPWFVMSSVQVQSAYEFVKIFMQFHFICGAGFNTYMNNDDCMSNTWSVSKLRLDECRHKFDSQVKVDPQNACRYAPNFINCFETEFVSGCGNARRDTEWWACEYTRINIFTQFPQCSIRCAIPSVGGIVG